MSVPPADTPPLIMGKPVKGGLPTNGQVLRYVSAGDYWESFTLPAGTPHDLLDAVVDQDTVAHPVAAGDLIFGNATPKWDGLAKGAAGAILIISAANLPAWLAPGTNGYLLTMVAGAPVWVSFGASAGYLKGGNPPTIQTGIPLADLLNAGGASGDIIYWNGTNFVRLAIGSAGQVLKVSGGIPSWDAAVSVTTQKAVIGTTQTTSSASYVDITDLTLTLPNTGRPCLVNVTINSDNNGAGNSMFFRLLDNGVQVDQQSAYIPSTAGYYHITHMSYMVTCSGQVIKMQVKTVGGTGSLRGTVDGYMSKLETTEF